mmetsp:Transcript_20220/g.44976  ORF Transcript_20220/g.44976 Transcript_20220/m.44976 type:complete len:139 (+) Transcript_20220:301-717(+)
MSEISSDLQLHSKWTGSKKDFVLHVGIGAQHDNFIDDDISLPSSQNSDNYYNNLHVPPEYVEPPTKNRNVSSADMNTRHVLLVFMKALYWQTESPFWKGFHKQHYGKIHKYLYELAQLNKLDESGLVTDYENGVWPLS